MPFLLILISFFHFIKQEYGDIFLKIFAANTLMLIFGFLGELNYLNKYLSLILGLFFFTLSFKYIFDNFIEFNFINYITLGIFIFIWLLYAVAFLLDFNTKNIAYNLLDLISKNCFGIFLFFTSSPRKYFKKCRIYPNHDWFPKKY